MSHGLQIINASGYVQIDENYSNFSLWATGATSTLSTFTYPYGDEIYLVRLPYGGWFGYDDGNPFGSNSYVDYRVYRPSTAVGAAGSHGMRVYSSGGAVIFDSNRDVMKIYSLQQIDNYYIRFNPVTIWSPSGSRPWFAIDCLGLLAFENADGGVGNISFAVGIAARQNGDNSVTFFGSEVLGWGPPIDRWMGEGARSYLFGE